MLKYLFIFIFTFLIPFQAIGALSPAATLQKGEKMLLEKRFKELEGFLEYFKSRKPRLTFAQRQNLNILLALANFYQRKMKRSQAYFRTVFRENPNAQVPLNWILDSKVTVFYEQIRRNTPVSTKLLLPEEEVQSPKVRVSEAQKIRERMKKYRSSPSFTGIVFLSNRPNTKIYIKGVHVGNAGQNIWLKPGTYRFTIEAPGYSSISRTYKIRANHRPVVKVELMDPTDDPRIRNRYTLPSESWRVDPRPKQQIFMDTRGKEKIYNWFPFGIGQFQNGESTKGIIFSCLQGGGLAYGAYFYYKAQQTTSLLSRLKLDNEINSLPDSPSNNNSSSTPSNNNNNQSPGNNNNQSPGGLWSLRGFSLNGPSPSNTAQNQRQAIENAYLAQKQQLETQAWIGFGIFLVSWVASVVDGFARFHVTSKPRDLWNAKDFHLSPSSSQSPSLFSQSHSTIILTPYQIAFSISIPTFY